jgi:hypothetical protein
MKLISHDALRAMLLAEKVKKHRPGRIFDTYPLTNARTGRLEGYQVAEVHRVGWWGQVKVTPPAPGATPAPVAPSAPLSPAATLRLRFRGENKSYVDVWVGDVPKSFGKTTLLSWKVEGDMVSLTLPRKQAEKRGFAAMLEAA